MVLSRLNKEVIKRLVYGFYAKKGSLLGEILPSAEDVDNAIAKSIFYRQHYHHPQNRVSTNRWFLDGALALNLSTTKIKS